MKFIGRKSELDALNNEYRRDGGFVVIYGRRRVGKTTLIKEFIKDKNALYFLATEEIEQQNMRRFADAVADFTHQDFIKKANFSDWEDLFKLFAGYDPLNKKILIIDEFQYLVAQNPAFPSLFQRVWDEYLKDSGAMVILCGSLISMMTSEVLSYSSPLYGRRTAQIRLLPLGFSEILDEMEGIGFEELVGLYSVTGGVPKYLEFFQNGKDLFTNIEEVILRKSGFLYEEPLFLLGREVREPVTYFSIIKCIAQGNRKPSQIGAVLEKNSHELAPYLSTLIELGLVEKRVPVTEKTPEKSRKGLYYISDHFLEFWFKFVYPHRSELELDNRKPVLDRLAGHFIDSHVSFVYEDICRDLLEQMIVRGQIDFSLSRSGSYWSGSTQIDVMAVDLEGQRVIAGECKYHEDPVGVDVYYDLREKCAGIPELENQSVTYAVFSKSGFTEKMLKTAEGKEKLLLVDENRLICG